MLTIFFLLATRRNPLSNKTSYCNLLVILMKMLEFIRGITEDFKIVSTKFKSSMASTDSCLKRKR